MKVGLVKRRAINVGVCMEEVGLMIKKKWRKE